MLEFLTMPVTQPLWMWFVIWGAWLYGIVQMVKARRCLRVATEINERQAERIQQLTRKHGTGVSAEIWREPYHSGRCE